MSRDYNRDWNCSRTAPVESRRDCCECERDCGRCENRHPLPKPVILACGDGKEVVFEGNSRRGGGSCRREKVAAILEIDTTCLCSHLIKIDFSTNMIFNGEWREDDEIQAEATFRLVKCCNGNELEIGTWEYKREFEGGLDNGVRCDVVIEADLFDTFCFNFCKRETCAGCCVYKVLVESNDIKNVEEFKLENTYINAIAQSL